MKLAWYTQKMSNLKKKKKRKITKDVTSNNEILTMELSYYINQLGKFLSKSIQIKTRDPKFHYQGISIIWVVD